MFRDLRLEDRNEGTAQRQDFAAIAVAPETVPASDSAELRAWGVLGGGGDMPPPKSVWADAHDLEFKLQASLTNNPRF
ncbi:hypothetical protein BV494_05910 [Rahnella sikkimica]|uniref:Uncharacterized protein n=1 Tax=Rahnella sikkimica TaxID=1805933 RepID=A0A2L1UNH5_9GAMM|nr:hypothetical protein BV494_05910 [Rahnella sikkimica]